jgi:plasmid stabilization system protein ParE
MRIRYSPRALDNINAILSYLERHSPQGAQNVARAMHKTIISEFGVRVLPVGPYPYLVCWLAEVDEVWVSHIRHTARRPWNPALDRA